MDEDDLKPELVTFVAKLCYLYVPLPPVTSSGHRAELWDVDRWAKETSLKVVQCGDDLFVRLEDQGSGKASTTLPNLRLRKRGILLRSRVTLKRPMLYPCVAGELFAECPLPSDGRPLTTAVEQVIDSSRYFVLRVVDRESGNHAFVGIGFRERPVASNFNAALDDYRQYLRRRHEAEAMRREYEAREQQSAEACGSGQGRQDYSLKGTIKLNLSNSIKRTSATSPASPSASLSTRASLQLSTPDTAGVLKLGPPPAIGLPQAAGAVSMGPVSGRTSPLDADEAPGAAGRDAAVAKLSFDEQSDPAKPAGRTAAAAHADDWGEFVG